MFCSLGNHDKRAMFFSPYEQKRPYGKRCMECLRAMRKKANPKPKGSGWRESNKTFFPSVMGYRRV